MESILISQNTNDDQPTSLISLVEQARSLAKQIEDSADISVIIDRLSIEIEARKLRNDIFGSELFGEPAWDILLDLFCAYKSNSAITVTSACIAGNCPQTTALRYLDKLQIQGLIKRERDHVDCRRTYVSLTPAGVNKMSRWLDNTKLRSHKSFILS